MVRSESSSSGETLQTINGNLNLVTSNDNAFLLAINIKVSLFSSRSDGQLRHTSTSTSNYNTSASDMPAYLRGFDSSLHTRRDGNLFIFYKKVYVDFSFSLDY